MNGFDLLVAHEVDESVGAELARRRGLVAGGGQRHNLAAHFRRHLQRQMAQTADAEHADARARLDGVAAEWSEHRHARAQQRAGVLGRNGVRNRDGKLCTDAHGLGERAVRPVHVHELLERAEVIVPAGAVEARGARPSVHADADALSDAQVSHQSSDLGDDAHALVANHQRVAVQSAHRTKRVAVGRAQSARQHAHLDGVVGQRRQRDAGELERRALAARGPGAHGPRAQSGGRGGGDCGEGGRGGGGGSYGCGGMRAHRRAAHRTAHLIAHGGR